MINRQIFAAVALASALCSTVGLADQDVFRGGHVGPAGDYSCQMGERMMGTLFVRSTSYALGPPGASMSGEYRTGGNNMVVTSGPLRGFGAENGMVTTHGDARMLEFPSSAGKLSCHEVL